MAKRRFRDEDDQDSIEWKDIKKMQKSDGTGPLIWGILAIIVTPICAVGAIAEGMYGALVVPIPFIGAAILVSIACLQKQPQNGMAKAGRLLGILSLIFLVAPVVIALAVGGLVSLRGPH